MGEIKKIIILGTGGNCIDILDTIWEINKLYDEPEFKCIGFLDDDPSWHGGEIQGINVLGPLADAKKYIDSYFINGIGSPQNFWKKDSIISKAGIPLERFQTIIHPTASVSKMAGLGKGVVILQNATVASNVKIGNHVIVLPNSVISHDGIIGDYTCIAGGVCVSGGVKVGRSCYLGTNSSIIGNITIGDYCFLGMGSVLLENVPDDSVFVGNPAKFLRTLKEDQKQG